MERTRRTQAGGAKERTDAPLAARQAELTVSPETVCFLVVKAREYDAQVPATDGEEASNQADDREVEVLEERPDDATYAEIVGTLDALGEEELVDLVALMWVGRGDFGPDQWREARAQAKRRHQVKRAAAYLLGTPLLGDYLEDGLAALGYSCLEFEMGRL